MGVRSTGRYGLWAVMAMLALSDHALRAQQAEVGADAGRVPLTVDASDADGDTLKYEWKQVGGPKARIEAPDQPRTFFLPTEPGEYIFEIRVSDGHETVSDRVTYVVKPPNQPPIAQIDAPAKAAFGETVRLDGSPSRDPDGKVIRYRWRQAGGPKVVLAEEKWAGREIEFKPPEAGDYAFELEVFDGKAWSAPARANFNVAQPNRKPRISIQTPRQEVELPGAHIPSGTESKIEPKPESKIEPQAEPKTESKVEPGMEQTAEPAAEPKTTEKKPPKANAMPIADAGKGRTIKLGEEIVLDASGSSDPLGEELTYRWEQKAGEGPVLRELRHDPTSAKPGRRGPDHCPVWRCRPTEPGTYEFVLEVSAGKGGKRKALATVAWKVEGGEAASPNRPPVLDVPAFAMGKVGQEVRIEAAVSDPENDPVDVVWTPLDPIDLKIPPAALAQRTLVFTPEKKGTYVFGVMAQDGHGKSEPRQVEIKVSGSAPVIAVAKPDTPVEAKPEGKPNRAPLAAVKPLEKPIAVRSLGQLDGTSSSDEDGDKLTYRWRVVEGAERVALEVVDQPRLNVLGLAPGPVKIELTVNDGTADSPPALVDLEIKDAETPERTAVKPPVAKCALISTPPFQVGKPVEFSGARSTDPGGLPLIFRWKAIGANADHLEIPAEAGERLTLVPNRAGDYTIELRVGNGEVESEPVSVTFRVEEAKRKPIAAIAPIVPCEPGGKIVLDATPSQGARDKSLGYRWSCVSNPPEGKVSFGWSGAKRNKVEVVLPKAGEYVFELKVTEGDEESDPVRVTVQTRAPNQAPQASLVAIAGFSERDLERKVDLLKLPHILRGDSLVVEEGWPVILDASGSKDPDNGPQPLVCKWKLVSGPQPARPHSEGMQLRFDAPGPGTMVYEVTVFDGKNDSAPAQATLHVLKAKTLPVAIPRAYVSPPNAPPPATPPQPVVEIPVFRKNSKMEPNDPVLILDGQLSTYQAPATGDKGLRYIWKQIAGEDLLLKPEKLAKPRVGLLIYHPGQYRFMLIVNDGQHASRPALIDVIVKDPSLEHAERPAAGKHEPRQDDFRPAPGTGAESNSGDALKAAEEKLRSEAEEKLKNDEPAAPGSKGQMNARSGPDEHAEIDEKTEDEGALLPPPKDAQPPSPVAKETVVPDRVSFSEPQDEDSRVVAGGGPGPVRAAFPAKTSNATPPAAPAATGTKDAPEVAGLPNLELVPGEVTARVERMIRKGYREEDPVFQRYRKRAEALAFRAGPESQGELLALLRERDEDLRAAAALALVQRGICSVPALIEVLEDRAHPGRAEAHWALRHLSQQSFPPDAVEWKKWYSALASGDTP